MLIHFTEVLTLFLVAFSSQLRAVQVKSFDMKLASGCNAYPAGCNCFFNDMLFTLISQRMKQAFADGGIPIVCLEAVAGITAVYPVFECISAPEG
jgi:hypothetical protein